MINYPGQGDELISPKHEKNKKVKRESIKNNYFKLLFFRDRKKDNNLSIYY